MLRVRYGFSVTYVPRGLHVLQTIHHKPAHKANKGRRVKSVGGRDGGREGEIVVPVTPFTDSPIHSINWATAPENTIAAAFLAPLRVGPGQGPTPPVSKALFTPTSQLRWPTAVAGHGTNAFNIHTTTGGMA